MRKNQHQEHREEGVASSTASAYTAPTRAPPAAAASAPPAAAPSRAPPAAAPTRAPPAAAPSRAPPAAASARPPPAAAPTHAPPAPSSVASASTHRRAFTAPRPTYSADQGTSGTARTDRQRKESSRTKGCFTASNIDKITLADIKKQLDKDAQ